MENKKAVIGIIGCGAIAKTVHLDNAFNNPRIRVKWCSDLLDENLEYVKNKYPYENLTKDYMDVLNVEATAMIKHSREHASLIIWCGGNELFNSWSGMDDQSHALRLLNKLCYELDYDKPYIPTSPLYKMGHGDYRFYSVEDDATVFETFSASNLISSNRISIITV